MLYAIYRNNVEGYTEGQNSVIYLIAKTEAIAANNLAFAFTDGHAVMAYADFYDDLQRLDVIDWELMESKYWFNTPEDPNRKFRRQSEFLIHQFCPWSLITEDGVTNNTIQPRVMQTLQNFKQQTPVKVYSSWYF